MANIKIPWEGWELAKEKPIGSGGFGKVYEIRRSMYGLEEKAAMKILSIPKDESDLDALRFEGLDDDSIARTYHGYVSNMVKEYETMQKLRNNPHVVHVYDFQVKKDAQELLWTVYIRMELLTPIMKNPACIQSEKQILQLAKDICSALIACHKRNILHRDIKPENIFIDPDGNYKIGDFGISRVVEHTTRASVGVGTYDYMSPEVINGNSYGLQADIYSLGMVLYYLMNERRHPFFPLPPAVPTYEEKQEARNRKWSGEPIPPPKNGCAEFKRIIMKACAFSPDSRYLTVQNMLDELNMVDLPGETVIPPKEPPTVIEPALDTRPKYFSDDRLTNTAESSSAGVNDDTPTQYGSPNRPHDLHKKPPKQPPKESSGKPPIEPIKEPPTDTNKSTGIRKTFKILLNVGLVGIALFLIVLIISAIDIFYSKPESADRDIPSTQNVYMNAPAGEWDTGEFYLTVDEDQHLNIKISDEFFTNYNTRKDGVEGISIRLYHDVKNDTYYNIGFILQAGRLYGHASYYSQGKQVSEYEPENFTYTEEKGTMIADLRGNKNLAETMSDIEDIQIVYLLPHNTDSGPQVIYTTFEPVIKETEPAATENEANPAETIGYYPSGTYMEETGAQRVIVDQWNDGGIRLNIYDENQIGVDLNADFFTDPEAKNQQKSIIVQLYHNLNKNNCYNISFGYHSGKLNASAVYLENGAMEYSYTPDNFQWNEDGNKVHFAFQAPNGIPWDMFDLEDIHVVSHTPDESPEVLLTHDIYLPGSKIQFNHLEGPDDVNGGVDTEKAVIMCENIAEETMWMHESDVKFEIYQSSRISSIGYINDKYYYTDDETVVVLNALTGKVEKRIENVGFDPTDAYVDYDGTLFLCCHTGPHFVELSPDGKIVHKIDDFGSMCDWAHDVYREGNYAYVACDIGPNPYRAEDYIFEIDLNDYSYRLTNPDN